MNSTYRQEARDLAHSRGLQAALALADRGHRVFPCKPAPDKSPLTGKGGYKKATTDRSRVTAFWNAHPGASIGVPTGERFWVLDVDLDPEKGIDGRRALEALGRDLPDTWTVRTPRGGLHLYFQAAEGVTNSTGSLPAGLDVRGIGTGYVLVPPSPGYVVENRVPIAEAPSWLLEMIRTQPGKTPVPASTNSPGAIVDLDGGPIPEGRRNWTMFQLACKLRAEGRDEPEILAALEVINAGRCSPPLDNVELERIAASACRYAPGNASPAAGPEVLGQVDAIEEAKLWNREWRGAGWKIPRSLLVVLIQEARRHGQSCEEGVRVTISTRQAAQNAAASPPSIIKAFRKLAEAGIIRRDLKDCSGTKSGAVILLSASLRAPCANFNHSPTARGLVSGKTLRSPFSCPRLRWTKPVWQRIGDEWERTTVRRLGKSCEYVVDVLERAGGSLPLSDLAGEMGIKRAGDLRRREHGAVTRLEAARVVEVTGDRVALSADWLEAINVERERAEEIADLRRDIRRHNEERVLYKVRLLARQGFDAEQIADHVDLSVERIRQTLAPAQNPTRVKPRRTEAPEKSEHPMSTTPEIRYRTLLAAMAAGDRVATIRGPGKLWRVFRDGPEAIGVVLDAEPGKVAFMSADDLTGEVLERTVA